MKQAANHTTRPDHDAHTLPNKISPGDNTRSLMEHLTLHRSRTISSREWWISIALLGFVCAFHILSLSIDAAIGRAIALRLYYIPALFAAWSGGLWFGIGTGFAGVVSHLVLMISAGDSPAHLEHMVELPF